MGEKSGRSYRLGDRLQVRVARVDMQDRKIDFDLVDGAGGEDIAPTRRKGRKSRSGRKSGAGAGRKQGEGGKKNTSTGKAKKGKKRPG